MESKNRIPTIEQYCKQTGNESEEFQVDGKDKLVQFFEILMQIDQRQKQYGKNNRSSNSPY